MFCLILHGVVAVFFVASVVKVERNPQHCRKNAQVVAHGLLGFVLLIWPDLLLSVTVTGNFNALHAFLQSFTGIFHLALAASLYRPDSGFSTKSSIFARAVTSFFVLFTRLFAAYHLSEKSTRGLLISDSFILSTIIVDGVWFLTELVRFYQDQRKDQEEVDALCKKTTQWLEGKGSFYLENALYIDSAIALTMCLFHFAFPQNILKVIIRPEHTLDSHHYMWCRVFGCLWLLPALTSFAAINYQPADQLNHLFFRLLTQVGIFVLNMYGHWAVHLYSPNHISAFMISGFFMSFHFSTFYRFKNHFEQEGNTKVTTRIETRKQQ